MLQTNSIAILLAFSIVAGPAIVDADYTDTTPTLTEIIDQDLENFTEDLNNGTLSSANYAMGLGEEFSFGAPEAKTMLLAVGVGALFGYALDGSSGASKGALLGLAGGAGYLIAVQF